MKKLSLAVGFVGLFIIAVGLIFREQIIATIFSPTNSDVKTKNRSINTVDPIASNLTTPWSIAFLPGANSDTQDMIITEREGKLTRIGQNGQTIEIEGVKETSEGGLLGVAIDPEFEQNAFIYLYYTTERSGSLTNQVDRYIFRDSAVSDRQVIIDAIPAASNHNGGAIVFGPDEKLYITTGDAAQEKLAQDKESLAGKILRLNKDGSTPSDNPFGNKVWSYGHRNPQGIAWDEQGQLWGVEHGPSGPQSGNDELNKIEKGGNYGWPEIVGTQEKSGMINPVVESGTDDVWAPSGMAYLNSSLYFAGLRGQALYEYDIEKQSLTRSFVEEFGRLRAVTANGNSLYISTSNRDGRGSPIGEDDRILRINIDN